MTAEIDLGMGHFFHPLRERDQPYVISGGRLTCGAVGDLTREGLSREGRREDKK